MKRNKLSIYQMSVTALMAAVICVIAPMAVPIGAVPVSFTMLALYLAVYLLGAKLGTLSYLIYLLLGAVGMPVFSGYVGGLAKLAGPTGGYLVGFLLTGLICGWFIEKFNAAFLQSCLGMILGIAAAYLLGTAWFVFVAQCGWGYAFSVCVAPFVVFDLLKILAAAAVGPIIRRRLAQMNLLPAKKNSAQSAQAE